MRNFSDDLIDPLTMNVVTMYAAPNYPSPTDRIIPYPPPYPTIPKTSNPKIFYLCDGKRCGDENECGNCKRTSDITHAKNFKPITTDCDGSPTEIIYLEQEPEEYWWEILEPNKNLINDRFDISRLNAIVRCPKCKTIRQGMTYYCSWCGSKMKWNGMPSNHVEQEEDNETKQDAPS